MALEKQLAKCKTKKGFFSPLKFFSDTLGKKEVQAQISELEDQLKWNAERKKLYKGSRFFSEIY